MTSTPSSSQQARPLEIGDITVIDNSKLKKAVTAAALGNAMEWFDFGVYGFVAFALGKVFFPDASPAVQTIAALGTFSVPFLVRPLGGVFFGVMGDRFGRQKVLSLTIIIMAISTFCIGLIPSYASIGIWAPILLLLCKLAQGFSVGGEYTGAAIFVAEYAPDRQRGFLGSWLDFGSIAGFVLGAGLVVLLQTILLEQTFLDWGWRLPFFLAGPLGLLGLYLRHAAEETPAFTQQLEKMEKEDRDAVQERPTVSFREIFSKYRKALLICIGMVLVTNITYYMLLTFMPTYLTSSLGYSEEHGVLIIIVVMIRHAVRAAGRRLRQRQGGAQALPAGGQPGPAGAGGAGLQIRGQRQYRPDLPGAAVHRGAAQLPDGRHGLDPAGALSDSDPLQRAGQFIQHRHHHRRPDAHACRVAGRGNRQSDDARLLPDRRSHHRVDHFVLPARNGKPAAAGRHAECIQQA